MSWLRDLALDSFSSYDEEDGEALTPTTALATSTLDNTRESVPELVRPVHPSRRSFPRSNAPPPPSPSKPRLDKLPMLCPLGAHDADVSSYLQNIGMTEESIVWARLNVPELFDMPVATSLKPGYKRLFDMPNPPSALVCQLKAVAALRYLEQLGMVGAPTQSTQHTANGTSATGIVPGTVYNAPAIEFTAAAGGLETLYDTVDAHLKPLVALLQRSALDVCSVVKVWGEMPTFFTSSYLPSVTETTTFLTALGLEDGTIAAFVASINPSGPPLQLEEKLSFLLDSAGLTRSQVSQVFREFPGIVTLDLERTLQPVVHCLRHHPRDADGLTQAEVMRLVTGGFWGEDVLRNYSAHITTTISTQVTRRCLACPPPRWRTCWNSSTASSATSSWWSTPWPPAKTPPSRSTAPWRRRPCATSPRRFPQSAFRMQTSPP